MRLGPVTGLLVVAAASCAARGGHTQLHRDENSKCGWVAREQLLWEQAEEEFSHSEGASWGKIQEFSAAMEGKQAGWGDGAAWGLLFPPHQPGDVVPPYRHCRGCGTRVLGSPVC